MTNCPESQVPIGPPLGPTEITTDADGGHAIRDEDVALLATDHDTMRKSEIADRLFYGATT